MKGDKTHYCDHLPLIYKVSLSSHLYKGMEATCIWILYTVTLTIFSKVIWKKIYSSHLHYLFSVGLEAENSWVAITHYRKNTLLKVPGVTVFSLPDKISKGSIHHVGKFPHQQVLAGQTSVVTVILASASGWSGWTISLFSSPLAIIYMWLLVKHFKKFLDNLSSFAICSPKFIKILYLTCNIL